MPLHTASHHTGLPNLLLSLGGPEPKGKVQKQRPVLTVSGHPG